MIVVVDFGSQTAHLIGRRIRDLGSDVFIIQPKRALQEISKHSPQGIVFSGGPASVYDKGAPTIDKKIFDLGIPILGICYGLQLTSHLLGGKGISGRKESRPVSDSILAWSTSSRRSFSRAYPQQSCAPSRSR